MPRPLVFYLCPECSKTFSLSGSRLKEWVKRKRKKPNIAGPYCDYRCSSAANVRLAVEAKRFRLESLGSD
jgi:DNA-directed RNA polymerase subunit RPC12/RpoP